MDQREVGGRPSAGAGLSGVADERVQSTRERLGQFRDGGRPELAANENAEIVILETYLPRQLTDEELTNLVQESVAASGAKGARDMGAVMKVLMPKIAGRAEGKRVSDAVKGALSKLGT